MNAYWRMIQSPLSESQQWQRFFSFVANELYALFFFCVFLFFFCFVFFWQDAFEFFSNLTDQLDEILKVSCFSFPL